MTPPTVPPLALIRHPEADAATRVRDHLRERFEVLSKAANRARAGDDREAAHDVRVATRRLNSALRVWHDVLDADAVRATRRHLRRLRRRAGRLRDLEVQVEMLHARATEWAGEPRIAAEALAARLERRLPRMAARTAQAAGKARMRRVERDLERALAPLRSSAPDASESPAQGAEHPPAIGPPDLASFASTARHGLESAIASGDDTQFHEARIAVKRWRYAVEALEAVFPSPERAGSTSPLRGLQQALGALQDIVTLRERVTRRAQRLRAQDRPAEADALVAADAALAAERSDAIAAIVELVQRQPASDQRRSTTPGA